MRLAYTRDVIVSLQVKTFLLSYTVLFLTNQPSPFDSTTRYTSSVAFKSHQEKSDTKYVHSDNESHFNKPNCLLMTCVHKTLTVIGDNVIATTVSLNHGKWLCYMTYCSKLLIYD